VLHIQKWANDDIAEADLPGNQGYLRVTAFQD
jgi:hypothetical protein